MGLLVDNCVAHLKSVGEIKAGISKSGNSWKSIELIVVAKDSGYEHEVKLTAWNKLVDVIDGMMLTPGVMIRFSATIKSRKWKDNYYTDITIDSLSNLGIDKSDTSKDSGSYVPVTPDGLGNIEDDFFEQKSDPFLIGEDDGNDLPF